VTILEGIRGLRDLKALTVPEVGELAEKIREFLVHAVARTGGHRGPNLGVVELTVTPHKCGVTFVLDRAGVTGVDGPSPRGMWDMSILQVVPGRRIAAPRDADRLRQELREAITVDDAPDRAALPQGAGGRAGRPDRRYGRLADIGLTPVEIAGRINAAMAVKES
jgi:deoxyxylulose-5-phosphate synthase